MSCRADNEIILGVEGAVAARAIHRMSGDQMCDTEFMSKAKRASWDFEAYAGECWQHPRERTDARPPFPPLEFARRTDVRSVYMRRVDVEGCLGCQKVTGRSVPSCIVATVMSAVSEWKSS